MNSAVIFDNVTCEISKIFILKNLSFEIASGDITGVLGQNGAGKSTLLSLINGLRKHTQGNIILLGEQLPMQTSLRQKIGVVLQETALYEELTTFENLRFAAALYNVQNPTARIIEVLELLTLADRSDQIVKTLSGGLRRRVAIARALLHNPQLLIIDEPTLGVDVEARHAIWQHLRLLKTQGRTIIVATNYLDEAQALCNKVAVLNKGKLLTYESTSTLLARAGYCLDIECEEKEIIHQLIAKEQGIVRIDNTPSGIAVFLKNDSLQKRILALIINNANIQSIRMRSPDLMEVFKTLEQSYEKIS